MANNRAAPAHPATDNKGNSDETIAPVIRGTKRRKGTDMVEVAAASASLICLVHCLALPLLILMLPGILGLFLLSESFHLAAFAFILPSGLAAFWLGYRRHHALFPAITGAGGIILLAVALLPAVPHGLETGLTILGSLMLVAAHGLNWRLRGRAVPAAACATSGSAASIQVR